MYKAANCTECICREINRNLSLIDCLEADSAFQNFLWSILIRKRLKSIVLCGDLQKAFFQIQIKKDCDGLKFQWVQNKGPDQIEVPRFTRFVFCLVQSRFILEGTTD